MAKLLLCVAAIVIVTMSVEAVPESMEMIQETAAGTIGCKFWRVRSITDTPGEWWQIRELQFYTSEDGSADSVTPEKAIASTYKGDLNTSPNKPEKAIDGSGDSFWSSSDRYKFEWIGVEFTEPQDIRSIQMELTSEMMGPSMVIVEKSYDGEWWSRSTEIADMKKWGTSMQVFPLVTMDTVPKSVFAFRSQDNPRFCVGIKPTPHPTDPEAEPYPIAEDAKLEIQVCDDRKNTQYWQLTDEPRPMLQNAADQSFVMHVNGSTAAGTPLTVKQCREGCEDFTEDSWSFAEAADGGLLRNKNELNLIMYPKGGALDEDTEISLEACGEQGETASIAACAANAKGQWELLPMFILEPNKQTIACAPYSHANVEPSPATTRQQAQEICAKDTECVAYNWVSDEAEGKVTNTVYACTAIHEVHSGVQGWELGIRAGTLEPFTELMKTEQTRSWTLYEDV